MEKVRFHHEEHHHEGHHHGEACHMHEHCDCEHEHHHGGCACCEHEHEEVSGHIKVIILLVSLASLIVSFINLYEKTGIPFFRYFDFAWIAVILSGYSLFREAFEALAHKKLSSEVLICVAILAGVALEIVTLAAPDLLVADGESYVFAAGEVAFLMYLGEWIEDFTVEKSRSGIEKMMSLAPTTVEILDADHTSHTVEADEVNVGETVLIRPGSAIAVDGEVVMGSSAVDESAITGESIPVEKTVGSYVYGGTMNTSGMLQVRVTKKREDMWIGKVTALMREAEGKRAPIARIADKWASYIVPSAGILAILVFLVCFFIPSISVSDAIIRGVTVLVVFCPCSLALATPTAIAAGIGALAASGMMVKNGGALENFAGVKYLCLDKTGTLTKGELSVQEVFLASGVEREDLLRLAASAEQASEHPIAKAIVSAYSGEILPVSDLVAQAGVGILAHVDGKEVEISSFDRSQDRLGALLPSAEAAAAAGATIVCVFAAGAPIGVIALTDTLREEAADMIEDVKALGVTPVMLTGDHKATAANVSAALGIEEYKYSLRPEDKTAMIEAYKKQGKTCMVGDGVNDAPALVTADCSVSIASVGREIAVESSDVALLDGKITKIPRLLRFSRRVLLTIKGNIIFAMGVNIIAVVLSALGLLTPVTGAIMHNGASILVVLHSALLLLFGRSMAKEVKKAA